MALRSDDKPAEVARGLRAEALTRSAHEMGIVASPERPNVFGILMEINYPVATVTLAVFAEGSTSLYFSSGGGVIGAGQHETVRETHGAFFFEAESRLGEFAIANDTPLPDTGRVRFYLRTFSECFPGCGPAVFFPVRGGGIRPGCRPAVRETPVRRCRPR